MNRRTFMTRGTGALLGLAGGGLCWRALAQEGNQSAGMISEGTQRAIDGSLEWLARQQHQGGNDAGAWGTGQYRGNVAVTSLGGLALMAAGHQPGRGRFGVNVTRAVEYVLSQEERNGANAGFLNRAGAAFHGPMYGHGFAALFLAEVYGMINEPALRDRLRATLGRSIALIIRSQNREGGWRYTPNSADADLSVTICQIMALRSARNAGIAVPKSTADKCTKYVEKCQDPNSGGFRYQAGFGGAPGFARTAAGVVALYSAGIYEGEAVDKGLRYLNQFRPGAARGAGVFGNAGHVDRRRHLRDRPGLLAAVVPGDPRGTAHRPQSAERLLAARLDVPALLHRDGPHHGSGRSDRRRPGSLVSRTRSRRRRAGSSHLDIDGPVHRRRSLGDGAARNGTRLPQEDPGTSRLKGRNHSAIAPANDPMPMATATNCKP